VSACVAMNHIGGKTIVMGENSCMTNSRKKIDNPPCVVGDIVTLIKLYRNGKPIARKDKDYLEDPTQIGYVVNCQYHKGYDENCIIVRWPNNDTQHDTVYIQKTSGCYLYKLS